LAEVIYTEISETVIRRVVSGGGPISIPYHSIWDFLWKNWDKGRFLFSKYFDRSLSESFHITIFHSCTADTKERSNWRRCYSGNALSLSLSLSLSLPLPLPLSPTYWYFVSLPRYNSTSSPVFKRHNHFP